MNEQIREIAEHVAKESELYCAVKFDLNKDTNKFFAEVFAELIVRECSTLAYDGPNGILEHFGLGVE